MAQRELERNSRSKIQPALSPAISPENFDFAQSVALQGQLGGAKYFEGEKTMSKDPLDLESARDHG